MAFTFANISPEIVYHKNIFPYWPWKIEIFRNFVYLLHKNKVHHSKMLNIKVFQLNQLFRKILILQNWNNREFLYFLATQSHGLNLSFWDFKILPYRGAAAKVFLLMAFGSWKIKMLRLDYLIFSKYTSSLGVDDKETWLLFSSQ